MKRLVALAFLVQVGPAATLNGQGPSLSQRGHSLRRPLMIESYSNATKVSHTATEDTKPKSDCDPTWTSCGPDSTDYNEETFVEGLPFSVERLFAAIYLCLISSAPLALAALTRREEPLTKAHMLESLALVAWLWSFVFLLTNILKFQSAHWTGTRPLTPPEAVYLISQILTTVGYGDITPAYPRGQVWVGINVIIALCLYGSIVMEVVEMAYARIKASLTSGQELADASTGKIKDWSKAVTVDYSSINRSTIFFGTTATVGILFWHYYPGEGKTWLQAVYMSIITLSTVGFGAFNAVTEGGKVFGAYWMLIGVAALGALITAYIDLMLQQKKVEKHKESVDVEEFKEILQACLDKNGKMDKTKFLKFGLMLSKQTKEDDFKKIENRFQTLLSQSKEPGTQAIRRSQIIREEGPVL